MDCSSTATDLSYQMCYDIVANTYSKQEWSHINIWNCIAHCNWYKKPDYVSWSNTYPAAKNDSKQIDFGYFSYLGFLTTCQLSIMNYYIKKRSSNTYVLEKYCIYCGYKWNDDFNLCFRENLEFEIFPGGMTTATFQIILGSILL